MFTFQKKFKNKKRINNGQHDDLGGRRAGLWEMEKACLDSFGRGGMVQIDREERFSRVKARG